MKKLEEITQDDRLLLKNNGLDGGKFIVSLADWEGTIIYSKGGGWEHVSVSPFDISIIPTWDEMCIVKDMFWYPNEAVIQIHPVKEEYINNKPNCLHLWRCYYQEMPLPPSCFIGVRHGQTQEEFEKEFNNQYIKVGEVPPKLFG